MEFSRKYLRLPNGWFIIVLSFYNSGHSTRFTKTGGIFVDRDQTPQVSSLFLVLVCLFVTCLLLSNIIAGKLIQVFHWVVPAAVILFPITYIFGDILTEVYGYRRACLVIWLGFAANFLMSGVFMVTLALPHPAFWAHQEAFRVVLGFTPRLVAASLVAYLAGELANSFVLSKVKVLTGGRWLWVRTIGSTLVGEGFDSLLFITVAFLGSVPPRVLLEMVWVQYLCKVIYEAAATPLTYRLVRWVKHREKMDVFDYGIHYDPLSWRQ